MIHSNEDVFYFKLIYYTYGYIIRSDRFLSTTGLELRQLF